MVKELPSYAAAAEALAERLEDGVLVLSLGAGPVRRVAEMLLEEGR
jgi:UDP-N-acetylmuramate-alanine ligase